MTATLFGRMWRLQAEVGSRHGWFLKLFFEAGLEAPKTTIHVLRVPTVEGKWVVSQEGGRKKTAAEMGGTAKANAMRSVLVVIGAVAFGYLTLQLGFKPYLEKAELEQQRRDAHSAAAAAAASQSPDSFTSDGETFSSGLPDSDHKL
ncbi:hypothetical protein C2S52_022973 [Perilla frutescens var. hirtella]|nr:hypothetical protein C2S52_022973 [Perilla frutescens var. hirtella]